MNCLKSYKRLIIIGVIVFSIHIIFIVTSNFNEKIGLYLKLTDIFCGSIAIVLSMLTMFRKNSDFYKYMGIGFMTIGILEYFKIVIIRYLYTNIHVDSYLFLNYCVMNLELLIVLGAIFFMKKRFSNNKAFLGYLAITIGTIIYVYLVERYSYRSGMLMCNIIILSILCLVISKKFNIGDIYLRLYIISILIIRISTLPAFLYGAGIYIIPSYLRTIAYLIIYEGIAKNIYCLEMSSIKTELEDNKKEKGIIIKKLEKRLNIVDMLDTKKSNEERRYYNLIDDFNDGIILYGEKIRYINKSASRILEIKAHKNFSEKNFFKKIQWIDRNKRRAKILVEDKWIFVEIYIVKIDDGVSMIYIKDITEIKKYEDKIREYESYLRYENIQNEFFTNISHELRTPINIINVALELNKINIQKKEFEKIKENNKKIRKNCLRLIRTINNFIDANKFSEGYFVVNKGVFNIVEVVENVVSHCIECIEENDMTIIFDSTDEEIPLNIDRDAIERVMLNLLSNSVKHRDKNKDNGKIKVEIKKIKNKVEILVSNNGQKINKIEEGYLFDEFTKINKSLTRENEGSGLGLYLSKKLLAAHSGELKFHSKEKDKNIFILELPLDEKLNIDYEYDYSINDLKEKVNIEFSDVI